MIKMIFVGISFLLKKEMGFCYSRLSKSKAAIGGDKCHSHMELNARKDKEITRLYWVALSIFSHWLRDSHRTNTIACPKLTRIYMLGAACSHSSCFSRLAAGAAQEQLQESLSSSQIDSDNPSMQANDAWIPHPFPRSLGSVQAFHLRVPLLFLIPPCAAKLSKLQ